MTRAPRSKQEPLPVETLDAILTAEIAAWTARGWKLETMTLFQRGAMLREPKWRAFLRDLVLVLVTFGLWFVYVAYRALISKETWKIITVDKYGRVTSFKQVTTNSG